MKKIFLVIVSIIMLCGCTKEKVNLSSEYYNEGKYIAVEPSDIEQLSDKTYILYTHNDYCMLPVSCDNIFEEFMKKYKIDVLSMGFEQFKETKFYKKIKFAPSIIIISNDKIIDYLDAEDDDDLDKYQIESVFEEWVSENVNIKTE